MLRTLVRDKGNLVAEVGDWLQRMQKSLEQMNVRVHRAVADIDGVTGMAILRAIVEGERDPETGETAGPALPQERGGDCRAIERALAGGSLVQLALTYDQTARMCVWKGPDPVPLQPSSPTEEEPAADEPLFSPEGDPPDFIEIEES